VDCLYTWVEQKTHCTSGGLREADRAEASSLQYLRAPKIKVNRRTLFAFKLISNQNPAVEKGGLMAECQSSDGPQERREGKSPSLNYGHSTKDTMQP